MDAESYQHIKYQLQTQMLNMLASVKSFDKEDLDEWVIHYIQHDEPQIAYTNLVAMIAKSKQSINRTLYEDILQLGKSLDITNGVTWNEKDAQEWWKKLEELIK